MVVMAVPGMAVLMPVAVFMAMIMAVPGMAVLMPVVPQFGLVQQKEEHQAHQQRGKQVVRARRALEGLGQQVHESRGQQGARRQAEQVLGAYAVAAVAQAQAHKQCGQPHAANACGQGGQGNCY